MAEDQGEKTEEATDTRRDEFRKRGQVAHSRELPIAVFLIAASMAIFALSKFFFKELYEVFQFTLGTDMVISARSGDIFTAMRFAGEKLLLLISPVMGAAVIIGIGAQVIQTGFLQVEDALSLKLEKLDPLKGLARMFSLRNLVEGLKSILKLILIFAVVGLIVKAEIIKVPYILQFSVEQMFVYMGTVTVKMLASIGVAMAVLSAGDYFFQRWDTEKQMRMTKQEVKEENKSREGDPLIKARIRRVQREMSNRRMMQKIPQADVIITNPTHIAIALKYSADLPAPQVIAKGADLIAEKIKEIARQHNIPVVENKPLARTIFKTLKLGQVIPRELFVAVAEVLSYVYKLRRKAKR
jgi:flagellar biosynthetic protein FlhB